MQQRRLRGAGVRAHALPQAAGDVLQRRVQRAHPVRGLRAARARARARAPAHRRRTVSSSPFMEATFSKLIS